MEQYIKKSALVAEMIKKMNRCKKILLDIRTRQNKDYYQGKSEAYKEIISFLSTLEVIEMGIDLGDQKGDKSSEYIVDTKTFKVKEDVVSNDTLSNPLEISRHGNSHIGETNDIFDCEGEACAFLDLIDD